MNTFAIVFLCIQGFLVQNAFAQCTSRAAVDASRTAGPYGWPTPATASLAPGAPMGYRGGFADIAYPGAGLAGFADIAYPGAPYGGAGEGNVAVAGELPVAGSTVVAGQVPIMGAVSFGGALPATGVVTITGQCACGCGGPFVY